MIDPDVLRPLTIVGACVAVFAFLLHLFTSDPETPGFRVLPHSARDWLGYWFRTLELILIATMLLGGARVASLAVGVAFAGSFLLLLTSSVVFWRSDRGLAIGGFGFVALAIVGVLGFPAVG